jgi:hypothetical protein
LKQRKPPSWWAAVRSGLVRDSTGKHYHIIRRAIWLYLYLIIVADRGEGTLFRKVATIVAETGFKSRSVQRWLAELRRKGYIETKSTGRSLKVSITKWHPMGRRRPKPPT